MTILVEEKDVRCLFYPHNTTYEKYFPKNHSCNTKYLDCISLCHLLNLRIGAVIRFTSSKQIHVFWWIIFPTTCCIVILANIRNGILIVLRKLNMVTFSFPLFQDGVRWEIFWQWQSARRQEAREEATGSSSAVRKRCYMRGDIIFVCSMNDQVVNMNVGVPISFL